MQLATFFFKPASDICNSQTQTVGIGKINLDVICSPFRPGAIVVEWLARKGQHPPSILRKAPDGGVAYAAAGTGQNDGFPTIIFFLFFHIRYLVE